MPGYTNKIHTKKMGKSMRKSTRKSARKSSKAHGRLGVTFTKQHAKGLQKIVASYLKGLRKIHNDLETSLDVLENKLYALHDDLDRIRGKVGDALEGYAYDHHDLECLTQNLVEFMSDLASTKVFGSDKEESDYDEWE